MMRISWKRVRVLARFKALSIFTSKSISPIIYMGLLMPLIYRFALPNSDDPVGVQTKTLLVLMMGTLFIDMMGALMIGMMNIAEEKEKHTLRVLMTSSVSSVEYLLATLIPSVVILTALSLVLIPISGVSMDNNWGKYVILVVSLIVLSTIVGFICGMIAKNSAEAGVFSMVPLVLLGLAPMLGQLNESVSQFSRFIYTDVAFTWFGNLSDGSFALFDIAVLLGWFILLALLFIYFYRKNGVDEE